MRIHIIYKLFATPLNVTKINSEIIELHNYILMLVMNIYYKYCHSQIGIYVGHTFNGEPACKYYSQHLPTLPITFTCIYKGGGTKFKLGGQAEYMMMP